MIPDYPRHVFVDGIISDTLNNTKQFAVQVLGSSQTKIVKRAEIRLIRPPWWDELADIVESKPNTLTKSMPANSNSVPINIVPTDSTLMLNSSSSSPSSSSSSSSTSSTLTTIPVSTTTIATNKINYMNDNTCDSGNNRSTVMSILVNNKPQSVNLNNNSDSTSTITFYANNSNNNSNNRIENHHTKHLMTNRSNNNSYIPQQRYDDQQRAPLQLHHVLPTLQPSEDFSRSAETSPFVTTPTENNSIPQTGGVVVSGNMPELVVPSVSIVGGILSSTSPINNDDIIRQKRLQYDEYESDDELRREDISFAMDGGMYSF